jgi:hypothetical protein
MGGLETIAEGDGIFLPIDDYMAAASVDRENISTVK